VRPRRTNLLKKSVTPQQRIKVRDPATDCRRMSRIQILIERPRRTLAVLATALLAIGVAIGSGANFSAQSSNPSNTFTAGTLTMSNSSAGAVLTASNMKPGDTTTGTVDIQNTGSISGTFSLSRSALSDSDSTFPMSAKLDVLVEDCGDFSAGTPTCDAADPDKYSGTLAAMTGSYALGTFAASEKHRYKFTVTFNSSADNNYQGDSSTATFQWDAVQ
jgi:spore coat-associated protein N